MKRSIYYGLMIIILLLFSIIIRRTFFSYDNNYIALGDTNIKGDVNGDGKVNTADCLLVKKHILNLSTLTGAKKTKADVNGDGKINTADYLIIKKIVLGLDSTSNSSEDSLRQICQGNSDNEEMIEVGEEVTVGIVEKNSQDWTINGGRKIAKITSGSTSEKLKKGEKATIKGLATGKVQIVVVKNNGNLSRCNVIVVDNSSKEGWKPVTVNEKLEWRYYDNNKYYKNAKVNVDGDYYYFDSNGYVVKGKEITYKNNKYAFNSQGQMLKGCVNGKYYNPNPYDKENYGKYQKTCSDTLPYGTKKASSISVSSSKTTIKVGENVGLKATLNPINTNATTKWKSSDTKIVTVDKYGIIEGKKKGTATITATNGSKSASIKITVNGTLNTSYTDGIASDGTINNKAFGIIKNASKKGQAKATTEGINKALEKAKEKGFKEVKLEPGVYVIDLEQYEGNYNYNDGILIPTGITLDLNGSVIKAHANNLYWYTLVMFDSVGNKNVKTGIKNGTLEGDRYEHKCLDGTLYENVQSCFLEDWHERGAGIRVWNSNNITIENMEIHSMTGDGVSVGSDKDNTKSIKIINNNIHHARRQGITISCAEDVTVKNNIIHDIYSTSPESAIDLESAANKKMKNITIISNKFFNNGFYYNYNFYDILIASIGSPCNIIVKDNEYTDNEYAPSNYGKKTGIRNQGNYSGCSVKPPYDISNNTKVTY